jgi:hypothetical protein
MALVVLAAVAFGRGDAWIAIAITLGVLGGLVGAASAFAALRHHASDSLYAGRSALGGIALALGLIAAVGGLLIPTRPRLAATFLLLGSLLGFVAMNFYDINTVYILALPVCWIAAAIALVACPAVR